MLAASYTHTGAAEEVLSVTELPTPVAGPGELRVRIAWSGVNPSDVKARAGLRSTTLPFPRIIPHSDGAGVVDQLGEGVAPQWMGQRVWLWNGAWKRPGGTAAQWIVVPEQQAVPLPGAVATEIGACLGIPAMTAAHAVLLGEGVKGKCVLVAGGAGAVGHYAIQMARLAGARQVIATVSSDAKAEVAWSAGADVVINYRDADVVDVVLALTGGAGVDRVIEVDMASNAAMDMGLLAAGGDVVVYGSSNEQVRLPFYPAILKGASIHFFIVYALAADDRARALDMVDGLLRSDTARHNIAARLPLADIAAAHRLVESGDVVGQVLLSVP